MSQENDLLNLVGRISDAAEELRHAERLAARLLDRTGRDDPGRDDPGWPAMGSLVDRLAVLIAEIAELPGPEIAEAARQASDYLDDLSDRADGLSY